MAAGRWARLPLVVFPELVLTGYTCSDLFLQPVLLDGCLAGLKKLLEASRQLQSVAVVGAPLIHQGKLFNCAVVLQNGEVLGIGAENGAAYLRRILRAASLKRRRPAPWFYTDAFNSYRLGGRRPFRHPAAFQLPRAAQLHLRGRNLRGFMVAVAAVHPACHGWRNGAGQFVGQQ